MTSDIKGLNILLKTIEIMSDFVDANQGYSLRSAIKIADKLQKYEALFFKQPISRSNLSESES